MKRTNSGKDELENASAQKAVVEVPEVVGLNMRPDMPLTEAGRAIMLKQLDKLQDNSQKAREGDPEGVHDMRVATRRLRAGLKVLEETVYNQSEVANFRRKLRGLANALGETRDADVFLAHLDQYKAKLTEEKLTELEPLHQVITARRKEGREEMLEVLDSKKTGKLLDKLNKFLTSPDEKPKISSQEDEATPMLVRHFSGSAVWRRYEEVLAYETRIPAPIEVLHRLRVACKRLRYTLDFFEEAMPGPTKEVFKQLTQVQDCLGGLHDYQVAVDLIKDLEKEQPDNQALKNYLAFRVTERDRLYGEFETLWHDLSGPTYRRQLAMVLGGE